MKKRRFGRVGIEDHCLLEYGGRTLQGRLLNISLKGALVEFCEEVVLRSGDRWRLSFHLGNEDYLMRFGVVVVHAASRCAGFTFIEADLNTMFHLCNLLESRLRPPERLREELSLLNGDESFRITQRGPDRASGTGEVFFP